MWFFSLLALFSFFVFLFPFFDVSSDFLVTDELKTVLSSNCLHRCKFWNREGQVQADDRSPLLDHWDEIGIFPWSDWSCFSLAESIEMGTITKTRYVESREAKGEEKGKSLRIFDDFRNSQILWVFSKFRPTSDSINVAKRKGAWKWLRILKASCEMKQNNLWNHVLLQKWPSSICPLSSNALIRHWHILSS